MPYPRAAEGAQWLIQPEIRLSVDHDDNPTLSTVRGDSVSANTVTPKFQATRRTERSEIELDILLSRTDYSGSELEDTNEQIVHLSSSFQTSQRNTWELKGEFQRDNVFDSVDIGELTGEPSADTDVGLVDVSVRRNSLRLEPTWIRRLTERNTLRVGYAGREVRFSNVPGTDLRDFERQGVTLAFSRALNPKNTFDLVSNVSRFRDLDRDRDTDNVEILAGVSRAFSETMRGTFLAGARQTEETDTAGQSDRSSGFALEAGLRQRSERAQLTGIIRRRVRPSGIGRSVQSDQLRVRWRTRVSLKADFLLRANLFRNEVLEGVDPDADRRYYEVVPEVRWRFKPDWFIRGAYRYRRQKFDAEPDTARSNAFFFGVAYAPGG